MKRLLLGLAIATAVAACATTTSPTGRTQRVGAVSQQQLDQMGAQAFAEYKAKLPQSSSASQTAYVPCSDCPNEAVCGVHLAMKEVRDVTAKVLDGTSLASLRRQVEHATNLIPSR